MFSWKTTTMSTYKSQIKKSKILKNLLRKRKKSRNDNITLTLTIYPALYQVTYIFKKARSHIEKSLILSRVLPKPGAAYTNLSTLKGTLMQI